jgi:hypothetical protein
MPDRRNLLACFCSGSSDRMVKFNLFSKLQCGAARMELMIVQG